jgi:hypothetical protein
MGERSYVAVCTVDCESRTKTGQSVGPRRLTADELVAHDDRHVSDEARVLVRMLRDASPTVRSEVLGYFAQAAPVYAARVATHEEAG